MKPMSNMWLLMLLAFAPLVFGSDIQELKENACERLMCSMDRTCKVVEGVPTCIPNQACPTNEAFTECGSACEPTCGPQSEVCPAVCKPNVCQCIPGYVRNEGTCIPKEKCAEVGKSLLPAPTCAQVDCREGRCEMVNGEPRCTTDAPVCGQNEKWNPCGNHCDNQCNKEPVMCTRDCKAAACACLPGFLRNANGLCVAEADCEAPPLTCATAKCSPGFHCEMADGGPKCVEDQEIIQCGKNEIWNSCGNHCDGSCTDTEPKMCTMDCRPGACACQPGFLRNQKGQCVPKMECETKLSANPTVDCSTVKCAVNSTCYMREKYPTCIEDNEICLKRACGPGKYCFVDRTGTAQCFDEQTDSSSPSCMTVKCSAGHHCEMVDGQPQCTGDSSVCDKNEKWNSCGNHCDNQCNKEPTMCTRDCKAGACACLPGLWRNEQGRCVKQSECEAPSSPSCITVKCSAGHHCEMVNGQPQCSKDAPVCGKNEVFNPCGNHCDNQCNKEPVMCTKICKDGACACLPGFLRNDEGLCVEKSECPASPSCMTVRCSAGYRCEMVNGQPQCTKDAPVCGQNEEFNPCGNHCDNQCNKEPVMCTKMCKEGACACLSGYLRNQQGLCVAKSDCTATSNPTVDCSFVKCGVNSTCFMRDNYPTCIEDNERCRQRACGPGKYCFVAFSGIAQCFDETTGQPSVDQCPKFEEMKKTSGCESCVQVLEPLLACAESPKTRCACIDGYARNRDGTCIPKEQCSEDPPPAGQCPKSEEMKLVTECETCLKVLNPQLTCSVKPITRCTCLDGYARNHGGVCVPKNQCGTISLECQQKKCPEGFTCSMEQVQCVRAPCPAIATCTPITEIARPTCASKKCETGESCQLMSVKCAFEPCYPQPICIPADVPTDKEFNCTTCPNGQNCLLDTTEGLKMKCVSSITHPTAQPPAPSTIDCSSVKCAANFTCFMRESVPTCIEENELCKQRACGAGKYCFVDFRGTAQCFDERTGTRTELTTAIPTPVCPVNENYKESTKCGESCTEYLHMTKGGQNKCEDPTKTLRCACVPGHFRDSQGVCVSSEKCNAQQPPSITCENVRCSGECNMVDGKPICSPVKAPDSQCKKDQFYNENYTGCGNCYEQVLKKKYGSKCEKPSHAACSCQPGFAISHTGNCVLISECKDLGY